MCKGRQKVMDKSRKPKRLTRPVAYLCFSLLISHPRYEELRNNPNNPAALSNLSPYLHFGQIAAQRCAIEAIAFKKQNSGAAKSVDNYLEELVVRRELSDNFCFYNELYDSVEGAASWARESLKVSAPLPSPALPRVIGVVAKDRKKKNTDMFFQICTSFFLFISATRG